jgi:hypothetical protein
MLGSIQSADLLDPLSWMAGPRRYRSGFCTEVPGDFSLAQPKKHCTGPRDSVLLKLVCEIVA